MAFQAILSDEEFDSRVAALKGKKFPLLSDGYICLRNAYGGDAEVLRAARNTSDTAADATPAGDTNLMRYLLRHHHGTPFEFGQVTIEILCPMDLWRQWVRLSLQAA